MDLALKGRQHAAEGPRTLCDLAGKTLDADPLGDVGRALTAVFWRLICQ
jgi:hypothetical protein